MKHADCIGLLDIDAERSGIHREAIARLERYRALLERALNEIAYGDEGMASLIREIEETIR